MVHRVLTAHSEKKFSAHVVVRVFSDGVLTVFPDNFSVGAVVRKWEYGHDSTDDVLYHTDDEGERKFIADGGVYTLRRQIRTMASTKMGQQRYFTATRSDVKIADSIAAQTAWAPKPQHHAAVCSHL